MPTATTKSFTVQAVSVVTGDAYVMSVDAATQDAAERFVESLDPMLKVITADSVVLRYSCDGGQGVACAESVERAAEWADGLLERYPDATIEPLVMS